MADTPRLYSKSIAKAIKEIRLTGKSEMDPALLNDIDYDMISKKAKHDTLMEANEDTPLVYLAEIGNLPDGRVLIKFGETDDVVKREPYLKKEYGELFFVKLYPLSRPHKYEQWLKREKLFVKYKYTELINGHRHEEVLAVTPGEFTTIKRFVKKHATMFDTMFDGWTVEQKLQKLRLHAYTEFLKSLPTITASIAAITDPDTKVDAEKSMVASMRLSDHMYDDRVTKQESYTDIKSDGDDDDLVHDNYSQAIPQEVKPEAIPEAVPEQHLFPPQAPKKLGRRVKAKVPPVATEDTPLQRFLDECFDMDPNGKTHVSHVLACHRLWRGSHIGRDETNTMIAFFKERFQTILERDDDQDMKCSFYKGLIMKPWQYNVHTLKMQHVQADVSLFIRESCDLHIMGRVKSSDIWEAFVLMKKNAIFEYDGTAKEKTRFFAHMKSMFVYYTGIAVKKDGVGLPGFYGLYMKTATRECREVGYNRSPNTHTTVLKMNARGDIVGTIDSQDAFAHDVVKKSSQYVCKEMSKCFRDGMKAYIPGDGYGYMRANDHATMMAARL